jgi:hypothetical protein
MPTPTYTPLATVTLGTAASSVTFSSIPATYRDLIIITNQTMVSGSGYDTSLRFNADSGSNYSNVYVLGTGSTSISGVQSLTFADCGFMNSFVSNQFNRIINIMDYSATDKHKTLISRASNPGSGEQVAMYSNRWANTAAITSVQVFSGAGNSYAIGSTFSLYGVIA